jgi:hypothetical protein
MGEDDQTLKSAGTPRIIHISGKNSHPSRDRKQKIRINIKNGSNNRNFEPGSTPQPLNFQQNAINDPSNKQSNQLTTPYFPSNNYIVPQ